jgi:carbamoyltransferase
MSVILGFSNTHNGSVALICDGEVEIAIQAERISRRKRQSLPLGEELELTQKCVRYCLDASGLQYQDIDAVALSTPWKVEKINNVDLFQYIGGVPKNYVETFYVPHHLSHMEYIVHFGGLEPGIVLVVDGSGTLESDRVLFNVEEQHHSKIINHTHFCGKEVISAYWFDGIKSSLIYRFSPSRAPVDTCNRDAGWLLQSVGHYWEWASLYCRGSPNEAGKVMGLAAFGEVEPSDQNTILSIADNGELKLNFQSIKKTYKEPNVFGLDLSDSRHHQNLALKVQLETEVVLLKLLGMLKEKYPTDNLYLSGGVALNVVANERIKNSNLFKNVILNGSVEDNGTAIGAGLAASIKLGCQRKSSLITDYYGVHYNYKEIMEAVTQFDFKHKVLSEKEILKFAAEMIAQENIIGWFQGASEFGPRALGNRSILANPASPRTKYMLDHFMKCRDRYRPYAPVVIEERASQYFDIDSSSPVMMRNVKVLDERLVAITHFDGTARVQTVNETQNKVLYSLLLEVEKSTGFPVLLNTSFNRPGEPIVESPFDALASFSMGSLDYLFLENVLISR